MSRIRIGPSRWLVVLILAITAALTAGLMVSSVGAQVDDPVPVFGHHTVDVGESVELPLTFESLPNGLSGFTMAVSVSDPSKLGITGIRVDAQDADTNIVTISDTDFTPALISFNKSFLDLAQVWEAGATYPPFVTVEVQGISAGNVNVAVEWIRADDDLGTALNFPSQATLVLVQDPVP